MTDPPIGAPPSPVSRAATVRGEIQFVLAVSAISMILIGIDCWSALDTGRDRAAPIFGLLSGLLDMFAAGMWVTMDRRRRGLEVGYWRFGAVFFGPVALCLYIILEYQSRALIYVPLLVAVYLATWSLPVVAVVLLRHAGA